MIHKPLHIFVAIALLVSSATSASAQTRTKETPILPTLTYTYDQEFCDFKIQFPTPPELEDITSFTGTDLPATSISFLKTFDLDKALRVNANCKAITKDVRNYITQTSLDQELAAIEKDNKIDVIRTSNKGYPKRRLRIATLVGEREGKDDGMYIYQVWVSDTSIFTLEVEVVGPEHEDVDKMLIAILKSFGEKETLPSKNL